MKDISGWRFGKLVAMYPTEKRSRGGVVWICHCDCGNEVEVDAGQLPTRSSCSHACSRTKHGEGGSADGSRKPSRTYNKWRSMHNRCKNPKEVGWNNYGGRGIKVCARWENYENFLSDMGHAPKGKEIDRKDCDGDYEPGNCHWVTHRENCRNKRNTRNVAYGGVVMCLKAWADFFGVTKSTLYGHNGKSIADLMKYYDRSDSELEIINALS